MMIFERDKDGLLHQVKMTVEDAAAQGRNINLMMAQKFYVLFTQEEEDNLKAQREAARQLEQAEALKFKQAEDYKKEQRAYEQQKASELASAQREAELAKDKALALALEQIQALSAKIDKLTQSG